MIPPITDSLINDVIQTENMVRAGQSYWRQGQVLDLAIDAELGMISAKVRGSVRRPYDVLIIFNEDDADDIFEVDCSCPVGFGCKHCAAALYAARDELGGNVALPLGAPVVRPKKPPSATPAPLPQPLTTWLYEAQSNAPLPRATAPEIAYVLTPHVVHPVKKLKGQAATLRIGSGLAVEND